MWPTPFLSKFVYNYFRVTTFVLHKKLAKECNCPIGEISPKLVTLHAGQDGRHRAMILKNSFPMMPWRHCVIPGEKSDAFVSIPLAIYIFVVNFFSFLA
jgi:hypothetical protein